MATQNGTPRTRREVLEGLAATLALAACGEVAGPTIAGADAAAATDAAAAATDAAAAATDAAAAAADAAADADADAVAATDADADTDPPGLPTAEEVLTPITPNDYFFITTYSYAPNVEAETWSIAIEHEGKPLGSVDWKLLEGLKGKPKEHTLECISAAEHAQKISNAVWTGAPLLDVFAAAGVTLPKGVPFIAMEGADGYTTSIPTSDLSAPTWLVWKMNGEPIPKSHGYPARLLVPGRYGMKSPKWITKMNFVAADELGFWEAAGWDNAAIVNPNVFVRYPEKWQTLKPGKVKIGGTAFCGLDPVTKVEVKIGNGGWQPATISYAPGADIWTLWHIETIAVPGVLKVQTRCTTASGKVSPIPFSDGPAGYDGAMGVTWAVI